jgi:ABC-2 type transport system permease protein
MVLLLAGIFGAITATGEYSTGSILSTLTADPVRGRVLAAKTVVVAALLFLVALVTFATTAVIVSAILTGKGYAIGWDDASTTLAPLLFVAIATAGIAVLGLAVGFIVRSGAGAIAGVVGLLFVLPIVMSLFSLAGSGWEWMQHIAQYLPLALVQRLIISAGTVSGMIPEWAAFVALGAWVAAGLLGAWVSVRVRRA